jgi:UDP-N-acetyl-D-glucosamine dehydrogenase
MPSRTSKKARDAGKKAHGSSQAKKLQNRIDSGRAVIGVIGMGYVGLPLALEFCRSGFRVIGFDTDDKKVKQLNGGKSYISHISAKDIKSYVEAKQFSATSDFKRLEEADCIPICVPTPLNDQKEPDIGYVASTCKDIAKTLRKGQLIILESTTYPGTTEELVVTLVSQEKKLKVGRDFFVAYSPEREDPGNRSYPIERIPKVVGGVTPECCEVADSMYAQIFQRVIRVSSPRVAEMTKLLENIFRCVNIALVNELKILCERMDIDIWEVIDAASTKPFGYMPFYPGPGLGGHCIPIDPFYLSWKAREFDFNTRFIELAGEINSSIPYHVLRRIGEALNAKNKSIKGSRILVLGVAYKPDVDDMRESPAIKIIELLSAMDASVSYHDPYISKFPKLRKYDFDLKSVELTPKTLKSMDCAVIVTNHSDYDYDYIVRHSRMIIDTRNATQNVKAGISKVIKA